MPNVLTPMQKKIRQEARRLAQRAGKDWKTLSREDRQNFVRQARTAIRGGGAVAGKKAAPAAAVNPVRARARKAAQNAGLKWQELSQDQRRKFLRDARR